MSSLLRLAAYRGGRDALAAFGLSPPKQPSPQSVGVEMPKANTPSQGLPKAPTLSEGLSSAATPPQPKMAFAVGMGASSSTASTGAVRGQPADVGRRRRSVIDRALRANEEGFATSSMPEPGDVSP